RRVHDFFHRCTSISITPDLVTFPKSAMPNYRTSRAAAHSRPGRWANCSGLSTASWRNAAKRQRAAAFATNTVSNRTYLRLISVVDKTRVLTLGGGFGGLYAALQFEKLRDPRFDVIVVNRENFFLFTPMLHEIAASDLDLTNIVNPVRKMIRH